MKRTISLLMMCFLLSMTLLQFVSAEDPVTVTVDQFKDLKDLPKDEKDKFDTLIKGGVFSGLTDDTFGLDEKMTRAQFAKVASIIFKLPIESSVAASSFTDVAADHWSVTYVEALKKAGLTNGYDAEGKMYNPEGLVSRQELVTFLIRGLGLDDAASKATPVTDSSVDDWAKGYVALALEKKLLAAQADGKFGGSEPATRKMLAFASFEAKKLFEGEAAATPAPSATPAPTASPSPEATPAPMTSPEPTASPEPAATPAPGGKVSFKGKKLLMISNYQDNKIIFRPDEDPIINRFKALGFSVTQQAASKIATESFEGYDLIFIGASANSKFVEQNIPKFKQIKTPIIYNKSQAFGYVGFSKVAEGTYIQKQTTITIKDSDHPMAAGLSGDVKIFYEPGKVSYAVPGGDAIVVANAFGDKDKATVLAYDKGTKNASGDTVPARTAFFFPEAGKGLQDNATDELWNLFNAIVTWVMETP